MIKILTFGIAREITGSAEISSPDQAATVGDLKQRLLTQYPALADIGTFRLAVNEEFASDTDPVHPEDEIAIIPPVSGG